MPAPDYSRLRLLLITSNRDIFSGHDYDFFRDQFAALTRLGVQVYVVAYDKMQRLLEDPSSGFRDNLKAFAPHAAIGLPYGYYALQPQSRGASFVLDELGIPLVCMWDHVITHMYHYFFAAEKPDGPDGSRSGMQARLKAALNHPLLRHYIPDKGHLRVLQEMGLVENPAQFNTFIYPARKHFIDFGMYLEPSRIPPQNAPAFFGNIFLNAAQQMVLRRHDFIGALEARLNARKEADWRLPLWQAFMESLEEMGATACHAHKIVPDESFFWTAAHDVVSIAATAAHRARVLSSIRQPTLFYGGFADEKSMGMLAHYPNVRVARAIDFFVELPLAYASHRVVVDVVNCPFITGTSPKFLDCFAAGGFNLIDTRADILEAFGDFAKLFMYDSASDLNAKIDFFAGRPKERADVIAAVQGKIRSQHNYEVLFARILDGLLEEVRP